MRLVDADAMLARLEEWNTSDSTDKALYNFTLHRINEQPTIEPERKKGEWIRHPEQKNIFGGKIIECSECGEKYVVQYIEDEKFCRNCGADMREEGEQDAERTS